MSGIPILYCLCSTCGFLHAPAFQTWSTADFLNKIYNDDYVQFDPDYVIERPRDYADLVDETFGSKKNEIRHLDYGGGSGELSRLLKTRGWNSTTFDPFPQPESPLATLGEFNLITAIEVFEHVPNPHMIMANLLQVMSDQCMVFFTTLLSDGAIEPGRQLDWWYAAPRNGHISLFSKNSIAHLAGMHGLGYLSLGDHNHAFFNNPEWALHLLTSDAVDILE